MKKLVFTCMVCLLSIVSSAQSPTAEQIVAKTDDAMRGKSSYAEMTMNIIRPTYQRSLSMNVWTKGDNLSMIVITAPAKDKGQGFLKIRTDLWNWIPSIDRLVKMSSSVMGQSWMGSDFTNDDMVKASSIVNDYTPRMIGSETIRGSDCWKIELMTKPTAAVIWGKVVSWIDKTTYLIVRSESYDEDMGLAQTMEAYDFKKYGNRIAASRTEIIPASKKAQKTEVLIKKATYDQPIADSFFSQQNLKNQ